jgi:hypothetical protein
MWWAGGPRWEFDDRVDDAAAPLFPSERRHGDGSSRPVTDDALRVGLAEAVAAHLPGQAGKLTRTCCGTMPRPSSTATA